ncbi:hypothetical protein [Pseudomonas coronafaciens]|nr:hypothetical protein [Pseudomonas coronafaciens]
MYNKSCNEWREKHNRGGDFLFTAGRKCTS